MAPICSARGAGDGPLACASAGNFGQGLAYAGRTHGREVHVFAAVAANPLKLERMRGLGAQVELVDGDFDDAKHAAEERSRERGWRLIVDGRDAEIAEGAATMALELSRSDHRLDHVLVPVGNGSLICGVASWIKSVSPETEVIAVGPTGAPTMERAWRSGEMASGLPTAHDRGRPGRPRARARGAGADAQGGRPVHPAWATT